MKSLLHRELFTETFIQISTAPEVDQRNDVSQIVKLKEGKRRTLIQLLRHNGGLVGHKLNEANIREPAVRTWKCGNQRESRQSPVILIPREWLGYRLRLSSQNVHDVIIARAQQQSAEIPER